MIFKACLHTTNHITIISYDRIFHIFQLCSTNTAINKAIYSAYGCNIIFLSVELWEISV